MDAAPQEPWYLREISEMDRRYWEAVRIISDLIARMDRVDLSDDPGVKGALDRAKAWMEMETAP
jgi:hypothetical protein